LTESWNGTNWTETTDLNTARHALAAGGPDNTSSLAFGGYNGGPALYANTEEWNGSNWTEVADLSTARSTVAGTGTTSAGLASGGNTGTAQTTATEEWSDTVPTTVTFGDS